MSDLTDMLSVCIWRLALDIPDRDELRRIIGQVTDDTLAAMDAAGPRPAAPVIQQKGDNVWELMP
jgi:hypothetical protein